MAHTSSPSYANTELKAIAARKLFLPDALENEPSPTMMRREREKIEKYSRLILVAKKQVAQGKRAKLSLPRFTPFVISDCGELAPQAYELQEWLVEQFRKKCAAGGPRADGCDRGDLVRDYRHRLKVAVQVALAAGLGAMINVAGQPWRSC